MSKLVVGVFDDLGTARAAEAVIASTGRPSTLVASGPLGDRGAGYRGHEFHYATIVAEGPGEPLFQSTNASGCDNGTTGLRLGTVSGSFIHLIDTESPT